MPLIILTNIERRRLKESLRFSRHFPETRGSFLEKSVENLE